MPSKSPSKRPTKSPTKRPPKKVPPASAGIRSVPLQERSRRRLDAIVEAAAELFADHGVDAVTMDAIARKAGTPIGSLYQYFRDKDAIFSAVSQRSAERGKEAFDLLVPQLLAHGKDGKPPPFGPALDAMIDGLSLLAGSDPMLRAANKNLGRTSAQLAEEMAVHRLLVAKSAEILALYAPRATPTLRELVATTLVDTVTSALVWLELRRDRKHLEETKRMVRLYAMDRLSIRT